MVAVSFKQKTAYEIEHCVTGVQTCALPILGKLLSLETGGLMVNRKYSMGTQSFAFTRLQVPAVIRVTALPIISFGAGPYAEFSMGDVAFENSTTNQKLNLSYESLNFDSTDFGLVACIGADIPMAPLMKLTFDLRYNLGLKDYDNSASVSRKFGGLQFLAGVKLDL